MMNINDEYNGNLLRFEYPRVTIERKLTIFQDGVWDHHYLVGIEHLCGQALEINIDDGDPWIVDKGEVQIFSVLENMEVEPFDDGSDRWSQFSLKIYRHFVQKQ